MNNLIYGNSFYLIDKEIKKILGNKKYQTFYLNEDTLADLLERIKYNQIFEEEKAIIIKNAEACFKQTAKDKNDVFIEFKTFLENNKLPLIIVLDKKVNEKYKINKELLSFFNIINTVVVTKASEFVNAMEVISKEYNVLFTKQALYLFANKCALNLDIGINELKKLISFLDKPIISDEDINRLIPNYNLNDYFGFKDSVINKDINKALELLNDLTSSKANIVAIVISLSKEYQTIYNIKALTLKKYTNERIATKLGIHPFRVKILKEASLKYSEKELTDIILYLSNLNYKLVFKDNLGFIEIKSFLLNLI